MGNGHDENRLIAGSARVSCGCSCFAFVMKTQKAKHGMPLKANEQEKSDLRQIKRDTKGISFYLV